MPAMSIEGQATVDLQGLLNYKAITDMIITDAIGHKRRTEGILEAALTKNIEAVHGTSVSEGLGMSTAMQGGLPSQIASLGMAAAALTSTAQQLMKGAQTTPPVTP